MYFAFVNHPDIERFNIRSLRVALSGAAPLPVALLDRFKELTGVEITEAYGLSETSPILTTNAAGPVNKPGAVGPPIPQVELRLVDDNGQDVKPGEVGEIIARGPNVFQGYWKREQETADAIRDGWFYTGDMARVDEDGYYFIVDRKKDMVLVSGFNVYPIEVENVLMRHPKIKDVAIIGIPDDYQGESVRAVVVAEDGEALSQDEVIQFSLEHLAKFKCPKTVVFRDDLPKSNTGKVLKRVLRDQEVGEEVREEVREEAQAADEK